MTSFFFVSEAQKSTNCQAFGKKKNCKYELVFSDLGFSNSTMLLCNILQGEPYSATKSQQSLTLSSYIGREVLWQLCLPFDRRLLINLMQNLIALLLWQSLERFILILNFFSFMLVSHSLVLV